MPNTGGHLPTTSRLVDTEGEPLPLSAGYAIVKDEATAREAAPTIAPDQTIYITTPHGLTRYRR